MESFFGTLKMGQFIDPFFLTPFFLTLAAYSSCDHIRKTLTVRSASNTS